MVPSSPIDPGRKPAAKVEQLEWFLKEINSNLLSHSLHFGLSYGDFSPDSQSTRQLFSLADVASRKRANQEKKIIERPSNAPLFHDLFREIHRFCKTVANADSVLALADSIENANSGGSNCRSQEVNWQCSAAAFCSRLSTVYSTYEDITIPCINEIRAIQRGLRGLALNQAESPHTFFIVKTQDELLTYPFGNHRFAQKLTKETYSTALRELFFRSGVDEGKVGKQDSEAIHRSIQLAALMRLQLDLMMHQRNLVSGGDLDEVSSIFSSLAHLQDLASTEKDKASSDAVLSEDDKDEKELRECFPNHGVEFERIVASTFDDDDNCGNDEAPNQDEEECSDSSEQSQLSDAELSIIASLHNEIFCRRKGKIDDNTRVRAFISSYHAASSLGHLTEWMRKGQDDSTSTGCHLLALALRCNINRSVWTSMQSSDSIRDFHNDPFPSESIRADLPLRSLLIRIGQLLRAFPGHAILVALGQVVERVRQLDIQEVSLGKVMSGLEVILRRAQDWEQHASQHVALGKPLKDISSLVASWRKLELQSWSSLLTIRENRRSARADRHWPRVYKLVHNMREGESCASASKPLVKCTTSSPAWVWKGHPTICSRLGVRDVASKSIDDLAKALDTFILTSDIAEFWARLRLIKSFAHDLRNECNVNGLERLSLARLLLSLCNYYSQFAPLLMQTKDRLREPIEKRLKDEVKLAKWDEQSYYSLVSLLPSHLWLNCSRIKNHAHICNPPFCN